MAAAPFKGTIYFKEVNTGRTVSYNLSFSDVVNAFATFDDLGSASLLPVPVNSGGFAIWDLQLTSTQGTDTSKLKVVIDGDQRRVNWRQAALGNLTTDRASRIGGDYPPIAPGSAFQLLQTA